MKCQSHFNSRIGAHKIGNERFVERYSLGVTNVRKISNFNRVDNQGATAKSAAALSHNRRKGDFP